MSIYKNTCAQIYILCAKVPKQMSFFLWIAVRGGILTVDNLVKRGQSLLIGVACVIVMGNLWIIFYSPVSFLMLYGVKFLRCLGSSGQYRKQLVHFFLVGGISLESTYQLHEIWSRHVQCGQFGRNIIPIPLKTMRNPKTS